MAHVVGEALNSVVLRMVMTCESERGSLAAGLRERART